MKKVLIGLTSIIIPVRYRSDLTRVCIDSILKYTTVPYELIFVQEGKDEKINKLLKSYQEKFIQNKIPKGFSGALNTGLKIAVGQYYCFLNNDTVVTPGWLEEMLKLFKDGKVGLVTPTFTDTETVQCIDRNKGQLADYIEDATSLKGVCFLIKKEVMDKIGEWDESFGLGGGDDNDICLRIQQAGYLLAIARKSYIYHYGSASFRELFNNNVDYSKKFAIKQFNKLKQKHNIQEKARIFISIPCVDSFIHHELATRLIEWSHCSNFQIKIRFYPNLMPLDNARNRSVKDFLEDYCDYFFHIDADIVPPQNCLEELLKSNKGIIAPLCFTMKQDDKGIWFPLIIAHRYDINHEYRPYVPSTNQEGIHETDIITGGCHLVKREVFEKLERPYYFTYHKNGLVEYSEDFVFSQQCQKLGYKLYTHYGLLCKHLKLVDIKSINDLMIRHGK